MKELIEKLVKEADLSEAMAEKAIDIVADFLEDKLPKPIASQVTNVLKDVDASDISDTVNNLLGGLKF
jgi:hypothetical protein